VTRLSEGSIKSLRTAIINQLKNPDAPAPELTAVLRDVAREARDQGVQPEQLIVTFKRLWINLLESLRPQNADQYELVRQQLVTLCIQAYYAE
jgi:hypothetical protein